MAKKSGKKKAKSAPTPDKKNAIVVSDENPTEVGNDTLSVMSSEEQSYSRRPLADIQSSHVIDDSDAMSIQDHDSVHNIKDSSTTGLDHDLAESNPATSIPEKVIPGHPQEKPVATEREGPILSDVELTVACEAESVSQLVDGSAIAHEEDIHSTQTESQQNDSDIKRPQQLIIPGADPSKETSSVSNETSTGATNGLVSEALLEASGQVATAAATEATLEATTATMNGAVNATINEATNETMTEAANEASTAATNEAKDEVTNRSTTKIDPPKPCKRLTLQERLAMAAKGRSKKASVDKDFSDEATSERSPRVLAFSEHSSAVTMAAPTPEALSPAVSAVNEEAVSSSQASELSLNQPIETNEPSDCEMKRLEAENAFLKAQLSQAKKSTTSTSRDSDLALKLAAKDETIKQLMQEGEALSIKELKLYESIRKLKAQNTVLEENLYSFTEKDAEKSQVLAELNSFLKANAFKTSQDLLTAYKEAIKKANQAKFEFDKLVSLNWEARFIEQAQMYKEEADAKLEVLKELSDLKIQSEILGRKLALEIDSKVEQIGELKAELVSVRNKSSIEISRLENKIELLRLDSELTTTAPSDSFTISSGSDDVRSTSFLGSSLKSTDLKDFTKLFDAHHNLLQQYLSAQENWKLIESNLINQVDSLKNKVEVLKKTNAKLSSDSKKINSAFSEQSRELSALEAKYSELQTMINDASFENKMKDGENAELASKFEKLRTLFDNERDTFILRIASLEEEIRILNGKLSVQLQLQLLQQQQQQLQMVRPSPLSRVPSFPLLASPMGGPASPVFPRYRNSSASLDQQAMFYNPQWDEIQVGESHLTPHRSLNKAGEMDTASNNSDGTDQLSSSQKGSLVPGSTSNSRNIHLISKMGNNIRRLEVELITLQDENAELGRQKELLEKDLLDKFAMDGQVATLNASIRKLEANLAKVDAEKRTMLELIGEKSEQVEELRADVFDLKEICRSQVTQMIEMQELRM